MKRKNSGAIAPIKLASVLAATLLLMMTTTLVRTVETSHAAPPRPRTVVPSNYPGADHLGESERARAWDRFRRWVTAAGLTDDRVEALRTSGGWVLQPVRYEESHRTVTSSRAAGSADYVFCRTRAETLRMYKAMNVFNREVYRIQGSLPFCVNSLWMEIDSFGRGSGIPDRVRRKSGA